MSIEFEEPILGWRTLKEIYQYYLAQTPSEDGISAAEVVQRAEKRTRVREVAVQVLTLSPERAAEALASIKEDKDQADRMRSIAVHIMTRDAAAGFWFAIGRPNGIGKHQFIHPSEWTFLLTNIEKGAVGRDGVRFEDLRCAFTKDVPEAHPIHTAIRIAQEDASIRRQGSSTTAERLFNAPPLSPADAQEIVRTGAPGRPSSMHLVVSEFERRCRGEVILSTVKAEAEHLAAWFKSDHPKAPCPTAVTIENKIRDEYRKVKHALSKPTK